MSDRIKGFSNRVTNFLVQPDQELAKDLLVTAAEKTKLKVVVSVSAGLVVLGACFATLMDPILYPVAGSFKLLTALPIIGGTDKIDWDRLAEGGKNILVSPVLAVALNIYLVSVTLLGIVVPAHIGYTYFFSPVITGESSARSTENLKKMFLEQKSQPNIDYLSSKGKIDIFVSEIEEEFINQQIPVSGTGDERKKNEEEQAKVKGVLANYRSLSFVDQTDIRKRLSTTDSQSEPSSEPSEKIKTWMNLLESINESSKNIIKACCLSEDIFNKSKITEELVKRKLDADTSIIPVPHQFFADLERGMIITVGEEALTGTATAYGGNQLSPPKEPKTSDKSVECFNKVLSIVDYLNNILGSPKSNPRETIGYEYAKIVFYLVHQGLIAEMNQAMCKKFSDHDLFALGSNDIFCNIRCENRSLHITANYSTDLAELPDEVVDALPTVRIKSKGVYEIIVPFADIDSYLENEKNSEREQTNFSLLPKMKQKISYEYTPVNGTQVMDQIHQTPMAT